LAAAAVAEQKKREEALKFSPIFPDPGQAESAFFRAIKAAGSTFDLLPQFTHHASPAH
jgi:hypothetical protein